MYMPRAGKGPSLAPSSTEIERRIDACRRGDRDALGAVFRAEGPAIHRTISRLVGPGPDADDCLQLTFETAIGAFPRFRGEASIRTWLTGIAIRVVHAQLRRPARTRREPLTAAPEATTADARPVVDARRRLARLQQHLDALDVKQRIAFVLHVVEGRSIDEIAALVDASKATTRSRVFWARVRLMKRLRRDPWFADVPLGGES